ncbi:hypothetical protein [Sphingobium sp. YR768]|uniref:hypothetical protein n=1 Tax=Sphingobium sp. YR768 TaxID=1884365 RepID=UPI0008AFF4A7|nr:hypothetical protein [Sphingobium sp. YR768]SER13468.1 hypothetical protein SAMN05518866_105146 [Sphingobium sp. YR768]
MTDGPFRNMPLNARWKRYGEDLVNDAKSLDERVARAGDAMLANADIGEIAMLVAALREYDNRLQLDFDPLGSIQRIIEQHDGGCLADELARNLMANLHSQAPLAMALDNALVDIAEDLISSSKNRLDVHCIESRELGDMKAAEYPTARARNRDTFAAIDAAKIANALEMGDRRAFAVGLKKKVGTDDGPDF